MEAHDIAQAISRWFPHRSTQGLIPCLVMWDLWWTKWHWGRFYPSTSVSLANSHSNSAPQSSSLIIQDWYYRANSG
jgi:hypothetical protein